MTRWSSWISGCPQNITYDGLCVSILAFIQLHLLLTFVRRYPNEIPDLTAVPSWAYLNVTAKDIFNADEAQLDNSPDSTVGSNPSSTASASSTQSSTITSSAQSSAAPEPTSSITEVSSEHKSSIVGGVVGAVAGISLLAALGYKYRYLLSSSRLGSNIGSRLRPRKEPTDSDMGKIPLMSSDHSNNTTENNAVFRPPIYVSTCTRT